MVKNQQGKNQRWQIFRKEQIKWLIRQKFRLQTVKTLNCEKDPIELTITLILNGQKQLNEYKINCSNKHSPKHYRFIQEINNKDAVLQVNPEIVSKIKHFQTHSSVKNYNIDYYLSLELQPLEVFEEQRHLKLEPYYTNSVGNQMSIEDYDILKCIGVGGFSRVYLVRKRDNGLFYAMKLIDKNFILKSNKEIIICNEKYVMEQLNSPYLAKLFYSFETNFYLVFVMEYCAGGELFYHLRKWKRLSEQLAKQYFVQVCLAINELHKFGIVYRDTDDDNQFNYLAKKIFWLKIQIYNKQYKYIQYTIIYNRLSKQKKNFFQSVWKIKFIFIFYF